MRVRCISWAAGIVLTGASLQAQQLVGYWAGSLPASGAQGSARTFVLQANTGTKQRIVLYSVDQDREPWTPDLVGVAGGHLEVRLDQGRAVFTGTISPNQRTISGDWAESGFPSRPLRFRKMRKQAEWKLVQPSALDLDIVANAKLLLHSPEQWDRHDDEEHKCDPQGSTFTVYCAFEVATRRVTGSFEHRDVALEEARVVVENRGKSYPHRLQGFNNDPEVTFNMLQDFFDQIERRLRGDARDAKEADAAR